MSRIEPISGDNDASHVIIKRLKSRFKKGWIKLGRVKSLHENQYIISNKTAKHLLNLGFKYNELEEKYI